jgi:hypothetical protein
MKSGRIFTAASWIFFDFQKPNSAGLNDRIGSQTKKSRGSFKGSSQFRQKKTCPKGQIY